MRYHGIGVGGSRVGPFSPPTRPMDGDKARRVSISTSEKSKRWNDTAARKRSTAGRGSRSSSGLNSASTSSSSISSLGPNVDEGESQ
jgi:hypothetical protein